jgi:hypothetical protein
MNADWRNSAVSLHSLISDCHAKPNNWLIGCFTRIISHTILQLGVLAVTSCIRQEIDSKFPIRFHYPLYFSRRRNDIASWRIFAVLAREISKSWSVRDDDTAAILRIFSLLDVHSLHKYSLVCRQWSESGTTGHFRETIASFHLGWA